MGLSVEMFVFEKSTAVPWGLMVYFDGTQSTNVRDRANYTDFAAAASWSQRKGTQRQQQPGYPARCHLTEKGWQKGCGYYLLNWHTKRRDLGCYGTLCGVETQYSCDFLF